MICSNWNFWHLPVADPGGGGHAPHDPVKINHKKDGCRRQPYRLHVSRPLTYPATGSATGLLLSVVRSCSNNQLRNRSTYRWKKNIYPMFLFLQNIRAEKQGKNICSCCVQITSQYCVWLQRNGIVHGTFPSAKSNSHTNLTKYWRKDTHDDNILLITGNHDLRLG